MIGNLTTTTSSNLLYVGKEKEQVKTSQVKTDYTDSFYSVYWHPHVHVGIVDLGALGYTTVNVLFSSSLLSRFFGREKSGCER